MVLRIELQQVKTIKNAVSLTTLRMHRFPVPLCLFLVLCMLPLMAWAGGEEADTEKQASEEEWNRCYEAQKEATGFNACFEACKAEVGIDEYNIGVSEMKDRWIACHDKEKCMYYNTRALYNCGMTLYGASIWEDSLEEKLEKDELLREYQNQWTPELVKEHNNKGEE